jgi:hypothetical protein
MSGPGRREAWLVVGVLAPFGVLVALGLLLSRAGPVQPGATPVNTPGAARATPAAASPPAPAAPPAVPEAGGKAGREDAGAPAQAAGYVLDLDGGVPPELRAPLAAVSPQVVRCLDDQAERAPARVVVTVAFTPTDGGHFARVAVSSSWQDPYLAACVEDVFAEVRFSPGGTETFAPARWRFTAVR